MSTPTCLKLVQSNLVIHTNLTIHSEHDADAIQQQINAFYSSIVVVFNNRGRNSLHKASIRRLLLITQTRTHTHMNEGKC